MKSSNPSFPQFRRVLIAAAVVIATGTGVALAQSTDSTSQQNAQDTSGSYNTSADANANQSASTDTSSMNATDTSATDSTESADMAASGSSSDQLSWGDRRFVRKAAEDGQAEVKIAQLAAQKATDQNVRQFAQELAQQHSQANSQLMSLAQSKNLNLKLKSGENHAYKKLASASSGDFDRQFIDDVVSQHKKAIKMYEKTADKAKDPDVKQFASNTLNTLKMHLQQAEQLQQQLIPTGGPSERYRTNDTGSTSATESAQSTESTDENGSMTPSTGESGATSSSMSTGASSSSTESMPATTP